MTSQNEPLYLPAPFFMIRTPTLPFEEFLSSFKDAAEFNDRDPLVNFTPEQLAILSEAILVASPSLYKMMTDKNKFDQVRPSLVKYISRMSTRSTPFGLFSFVSVGAWGDSASVAFDLEKVKKRARPDMEWLYEVISCLCANPALKPSLEIYRNPLAYESGGRVCLKYYRNKAKEKHSETLSICFSPLIQEILQAAEAPITLQNLVENLIEKRPSLDRDKLQGMIELLLEQQFLSFSLYPSLLTDSAFDDLLLSLSLTPLQYPELQKIANDITNYNSTPLGKGERQLLGIKEAMESIEATRNQLQVDSFYNESGNTLPNAIFVELQKAVEVLWTISQNTSYEPSLKSYHTKFLEKYGRCRTVPIQDLLHEETGIGIPECYLENFSKPKAEEIKGSKWKAWLENQWAQCLRDKKQEIELTEAVLGKVLEPADNQKAPLSFDLFFEVIVNSQEEIDSGAFFLSPFAKSSQGGSTFGRFLDVLGTPAKEMLHAFLREEEANEKGSLFADYSYLPHLPRHANVSTQPKLRQFTIDLGGSGNLGLHEIFVGANSERFYLTLKDSSKELIVTSSNMLVSKSAPFPLRFLLDVSQNRYQTFPVFQWTKSGHVPFFPRIRFKKSILSPACWKVGLLQLDLTTKANSEAISRAFRDWSKQWEMPRYCFMEEGDNKILLDLENAAHLAEVATQLKKGRVVSLSEKIGQVEGQWIKSQRGTHLSEFVVPFRKNPKYGQSLPLTFHYTNSSKNEFRLKFPGSEWLFAKIYLAVDKENRFLADQYYRFVSSLLEQKIISGAFFVRYSDTRQHLRLRFVGDKENITRKLLPALNDWSHTLIKGKFISDISLCTYDREVERYGGEQLIELAEALFFVDSFSAIPLIKAMLSKKITLKEEVVAALSVIDLLKQLGLNLSQQISFFSFYTKSKDMLKGFREDKTNLMGYGKAILNDGLLEYAEEGVVLSEAFQIRQPILQAFAKEVVEAEGKKELSMHPHMIFESIVHMHCNRLLSGREQNKEAKVRQYAFHTLTAIQEEMKCKRLLQVS